MSSEVVETKASKIWLDDDIVWAIVKPGLNYTIEEAKKGTQTIIDLCKDIDHKIPLLVDLSEVLSIDKESREHFASQDVMSAIVLIVNSPLSRVIGNFFIGLNKLAVPCKIFSSSDAAVLWLRGYKNDRNWK